MIQVTWYPVADSTALLCIAESEQPFQITVTYAPDDKQEIISLHDGLVHFVAVDIPPAANVEVQGC